MRYRARLPLSLPPFPSISFCSPFLSLIPVLCIAYFLPDEFNSCLSRRERERKREEERERERERERTDALSIFPVDVQETSSSRISISMHAIPSLPQKHSFIAFQYHALTRRIRPYVSFEPRMEKRVVSISSARPYMLRPEVENYRRNTETAARL